MSKYIIDTDQFEKLFETKAVAVLGIGDNLAVPEEGEKTVWTRMLNVADLEELNSDYINEHFEDLQDDAYNKGYAQCQDDYGDALKHAKDTAYQKGLEDAWKAARKIVCDEGIDMNTLCTIFRRGCSDSIIRDYPASEAIAKLKAYEEKQNDKIEVGDEVIYNGTTKCIVVRPEDDERYASLIDSDGTHYSADHRECKKTGRHFDIASILEATKA